VSQAIAQVNLIPPPTNPQHWLAGRVDDAGNFAISSTSHVDSYYDSTTYHAYLVNVKRDWDYKTVWIHMTLNVVNATFDPADQNNPWVTVVGGGIAGANYVTTDLRREFAYSGSSMQFLEL